MRRILVSAMLVAASGACSSKKEPPVAAHSPLADSADQIMYGASFVLTEKGVAHAQMHGDTLYFFDDNTRIESEKPTITFFTSTGAKDAVLTALHGTSNTRSNNMIARGNVVVVSEDGRRLTTEELLYNQGKNEISSDSAFVMTEPNRRLAGIGFRSDPNMKNIQILKAASGFVRAVSTGPATTPAQPGATPTQPVTTPTQPVTTPKQPTPTTVRPPTVPER